MEKIKALQLNITKSIQLSWPKTSKLQKIIATTLLSLVVFLFLTYLLFYGYQRAYAGRFFPGVTINGIDLGGKTRVQANALLDEKITKIKEQNIKVNVSGEIKDTNLNNLGIDVEVNQSFEQAYGYAREGGIFKKVPENVKIMFANKNFDLSLKYSDESEAKLNQFASTINKDAKNATVAVNNNTLSVVKEEWGKSIDYNSFKEDLYKYIFGQTTSMVILKTTDLEPAVKSAQVELVKTDVEKIVFPEIVLIDQEKNQGYTANPEEIAKWIIIKADLNGDLAIETSNDKIKSYLKSLSKKTDQELINRKIKEKDGSVIIEGQDGRNFDQEKALNDINEQLIDRKIDKATNNIIDLSFKVKPKKEDKVAVWEASPAGGGTPGLSEGKYVEIILSEQRAYLFNGNNLEGSFIISSGKASTPTPEGVRYVSGKSDRTWSAKFKLYMPYWQDLGGGYGLHELPEWPGGAKEGQAHLGTPVSHGCVRFGIGDAQTVYNWTDIGTPVFIHK